MTDEELLQEARNMVESHQMALRQSLSPKQWETRVTYPFGYIELQDGRIIRFNDKLEPYFATE